MKYRFDPFPSMCSSRLQLRPFTVADTTRIYALRSNPAVAKYLDRPLMKEVSEVEAYLAKMQEGVRQGKWIIWGIHYLEQGFVGSICLWNFSRAEVKAEIGYELLPPFERKGIMTEAIPLVLAFGFDRLQLQQIEAEVAPANAPSIRPLEKFGFEQPAHIASQKDTHLQRYVLAHPNFPGR